MEVSGQIHASAALPRDKRPRYPLDRRLSGFGGPSERDEISFHAVPDISGWMGGINS
jgi:hypothetical protein